MLIYCRGFYIILIFGVLMTGCITDIYKSAVDERSLGDQYVNTLTSPPTSTMAMYIWLENMRPRTKKTRP
jgi:hypothetical protein